MSLHIKLKDILFLDIETVPQEENFGDLSLEMQELWMQKATRLDKNEKAHTLYKKAGIYAEFGKIVCISVGFINTTKDSDSRLRLKSFFGTNEKQLLLDFRELTESSYKNKYLCAHNGKEFDFPYIARRMLLNGISLPEPLDIAGKKPWNIRHLDTLQLWKFGDYKHYTSLKLLTTIFNIPSPKDDIDGSMVKEVYYKEKDLNRIMLYCEKDVTATVQLFMRYQNKPLIPEENIISVSK
ncbi:MAG: 3'-5' exonuclease [Bacteroidota bacterium]|nr:3'-5' exonuclease [Bacteroidota bacterium]